MEGWALTLVQVAISGVLLGAVYALLAIGLNLIFGVMRIINIAHGDLLMLGAYATFWLFTLWGVNPLLALVAVSPGMFLLGVALQRVLVDRVVGQPLLSSLLLTFGLSSLLTGLALNLWTANYRSVPAFSGSLVVGGVAVSIPRLIAFSVALAITAAVYLFLTRAKLGKAVRATAQNAEVALVCGIDVARIRLLVFGLGTALAAAAGALLAVIYTIYPEMGRAFLMKAFAIIVLGGLGSFQGAFLGALALGVAEAFAGYIWNTQIAEAVAYVVFIGVLLVRPGGLFGTSE
ncbi:MAG TPA: branched-chain amino acid ABC transporter permease [Chloroflexota bacterium]|nr:branched-chain amino acid ABC transporter permease [Chloroflexota bacterium]